MCLLAVETTMMKHSITNLWWCKTATTLISGFKKTHEKSGFQNNNGKFHYNNKKTLKILT